MNDVSKLYEEIKPLIDEGDNQAALEAMEELIRNHTDFAKGYHDLGILYLSAGIKEKAESNFLKAIDCEPENNTFLRSLADFYHVEMENSEDALAYYKKMIANDVESAEVFFVAGNLSLVGRNFDDAVGYYEKVLGIEPWHMEAFDYLEKVKAYINSKNLDPENMSVAQLYQKAAEIGAEGKNALAVELLEKIIEIDPDHALAHNDMGVYLYQMGNEEKSLACYRRATQLDPLNTNLQKNLADFLCFVQGDVLPAMEIYFRLLQDDPEDVEVLLAAGYVNQAIGRPDDAELFYERVIDIEPWNIEAAEKLEALKTNMKNCVNAV